MHKKWFYVWKQCNTNILQTEKLNLKGQELWKIVSGFLHVCTSHDEHNKEYMDLWHAMWCTVMYTGLFCGAQIDIW